MAVSASHALPYPIKGCRFTFPIQFTNASLAPTDPTTPDTEVSKDGAAFADASEEVSVITGSNGFGYITLTGDETNCSVLAVAAKAASGPVTTLLNFQPAVLPIIASGTASAGAAGTITLQSGTIAIDYKGAWVRTTGGTGGGGGSGSANNQVRRIISYNTSTRVATISPNWETTPDNTTTYEILMSELCGGTVGGALPYVVPGASGGLLIAGTNAATSFTSGLTISNTSADALTISTTTSGRGVAITSTGSSEGVKINSASGYALHVESSSNSGVYLKGGTSSTHAALYIDAASTGRGCIINSVGGPGLAVASSGSFGITVTGGSSASGTAAADAVLLTGGANSSTGASGSGLAVISGTTNSGTPAAGLRATGGNSTSGTGGRGAYFLGGTTSGSTGGAGFEVAGGSPGNAHGMKMIGGSSNGSGLRVEGNSGNSAAAFVNNGNGSAMNITAGATVSGGAIAITGGSSSGPGIVITTTSGHAITTSLGGSSVYGFNGTLGTNAISNVSLAADTGLKTQDSGLIQSGGTAIIGLASTASSSNDVYNGSVIKIVSGTGAGQARTITDYDGMMKSATVSPDWAVAPDTTSFYALIGETGFTNSAGKVSISQAFPTNFSSLAITGGGAVTVGTNGDKTGYSLSQAFPTNFSSLAITGGGAVTVGTNSDKTGYSLSQAFPTNFSSLSIDGSGKVLLQATQTGVTIPTVTNVTNGVVVTTNNDKTGYSLTQAFPTNFSSLVISGAGKVTVGTNDDKTGYSLTQAFPTNFSSMLISVAGKVTVGTNDDKSGYSLSQSFPTNFASLAITAGGAVTVGTNNDKTGYSLSQAFPTNFSTLSIDGSGKVLLQATQTGVTIPTVTTVTNGVTVTTNNDKTGYSLTQTFPANFSSLVISVAGKVTVGTNDDKTGYSLTQAFPTNFSSLSIDGTGKVLLQATQTGVTIPTVTNVSNVTTSTVDSSGVTTLLSRLSSSRAGYLDFLNVGGNVATATDIANLNLSASKRIVVSAVPQMEIPASSTAGYTVEIRTYDADGAPTNADSTPTVAPTGSVNGDLSANMGAISNVTTGVYRGTYTVSSTDDTEQVRFDASATISSVTHSMSFYSLVSDASGASSGGGFGSTEAAQLQAIYDKLPSKAYLTGTANTTGDIEMDDATGNYPGTVAEVVAKTGYSLSQAFPTNFASLAITGGGAVTVGTNGDKTGYSLAQSFPANFSALSIDVAGKVLLQATQTGVTIPTVTAVTNGVTVSTNNDKTGYSLSQAFPTNFSLLSIDGSGKVLLQATQTGVTIPTVSNVTNGVVVATNNDKTGYSLSQAFPTNFSSLLISGSGKVTVGTNDDKTGYSLSQAFPANFASLAISLGGAVTVGTNNDKTGYSLSQAFPSNFSSLVISGAGKVTVGTNDDKTGYSLSQTFPTNFSALSIDVSGNVALSGAALSGVFSNILGNSVDSVEDTASPYSLAAVVLQSTKSAIVGANLVVDKTDGSLFHSYPVATDAAADNLVGIG